MFVEKSVAASVLEVFHGIHIASKRRYRWSQKASTEELFGTVAALLFRGHTHLYCQVLCSDSGKVSRVIFGIKMSALQHLWNFVTSSWQSLALFIFIYLSWSCNKRKWTYVEWADCMWAPAATNDYCVVVWLLLTADLEESCGLKFHCFMAVTEQNTDRNSAIWGVRI